MKPIDFECPHCTAIGGVPCAQPTYSALGELGGHMQIPYYHSARVDAALTKLQEVTRTDLDVLSTITDLLRKRIECLETLVMLLGNLAEATDKSLKLHNERLDFVTQLARSLT